MERLGEGQEHWTDSHTEDGTAARWPLNTPDQGPGKSTLAADTCREGVWASVPTCPGVLQCHWLRRPREWRDMGCRQETWVVLVTLCWFYISGGDLEQPLLCEVGSPASCPRFGYSLFCPWEVL